MNLVILSKTEWGLLCTHGFLDVLSSRFARLDENVSCANEGFSRRVFERAPRYVVGDALGIIVADVEDGVPQETTATATTLLSLRAIKRFFALTELAHDYLCEEAERLQVRLSEPVLETAWREWTESQRRLLRTRTATSLVQALNLGHAFGRGENSGWEGVPDGVLGIHDKLSARLHLDSRKVISDDRSRATEGRCAHAIVSASLWASLCSGRSVPPEESPLTAELEGFYDQLINLRFGEIDHLTRSLHHALEQLRLHAAEAFGDFVSPSAVGVYFHFLIAARYGPLPPVRQLVRSLLRLQELDGDRVAGMCAYLIGLELAPELVHQIALSLADNVSRVVDSQKSRELTGLAPLEIMRVEAANVPA